MDIYSYLKKDHRLVSNLMDEVLASTKIKEREALFAQIKQELIIHAETEEATFYKAVEKASRSKNVHEKIEHADEEHQEIRSYLEQLSTIPMATEEWIEKFGEFKHAVAHHVKEEENDIFEKAKNYLSKEKAEQLAEEMENLKQQEKKGDMVI